MALEFVGKNVLLVDGQWRSPRFWHPLTITAADSIVRGTTSKEIVQMARDVGAKKIVFASCAPPIRYSNVYGIDMPSRHELVAHGRTEEGIAAAIGADLVIYQTLDDLVWSVRQFNATIECFDCSVFTGEYVTGDVDEEYLQRLEANRADNMKGKVMDYAGEKTQVNGHGVHGTQRDTVSTEMSCSDPLNGADDTIGLYNFRKT